MTKNIPNLSKYYEFIVNNTWNLELKSDLNEINGLLSNISNISDNYINWEIKDNFSEIDGLLSKICLFIISDTNYYHKYIKKSLNEIKTRLIAIFKILVMLLWLSEMLHEIKIILRKVGLTISHSSEHNFIGKMDIEGSESHISHSNSSILAYFNSILTPKSETDLNQAFN